MQSRNVTERKEFREALAVAGRVYEWVVANSKLPIAHKSSRRLPHEHDAVHEDREKTIPVFRIKKILPQH